MRARLVAVIAVLAALVGVVLVASPASAHPNVVAAGPLHAGTPVRLTVLLFGDEGAVTGMDLTFPVSFDVTAVHPAQGDFGTINSSPHTISSRHASIPFGQSGYLLVDGVPRTSTDFTVDVVAQLSDGQAYHYKPVRVVTDGSDPSAATSKGPLGGTAGKIGIAVGVAAVAALLAVLRMRLRRTRRRT